MAIPSSHPSFGLEVTYLRQAPHKPVTGAESSRGSHRKAGAGAEGPGPSQAGSHAVSHPAPAKPLVQGQAQHTAATLGNAPRAGLAGKGGSSPSIRKQTGRRPDTGEP